MTTSRVWTLLDPALVVNAMLIGATVRPAIGGRRDQPTAPAIRAGRSSVDRTAVRAVLHDCGFWLLLTGFTAHSAAIATVAAHLIAYLTTLAKATAPLAAAVIYTATTTYTPVVATVAAACLAAAACLWRASR